MTAYLAKLVIIRSVRQAMLSRISNSVQGLTQSYLAHSEMYFSRNLDVLDPELFLFPYRLVRQISLYTTI
jgi:hypothetical protein